eukprot:4400960-Pleurochrysis_carterae.AAC.1
MCPTTNCRSPSCTSGDRVSVSLVPSSCLARGVPLHFPLAYTLADCRPFTRSSFNHFFRQPASQSSRCDFPNRECVLGGALSKFTPSRIVRVSSASATKPGSISPRGACRAARAR